MVPMTPLSPKLMFAMSIPEIPLALSSPEATEFPSDDPLSFKTLIICRSASYATPCNPVPFFSFAIIPATCEPCPSVSYTHLTLPTILLV